MKIPSLVGIRDSSHGQQDEEGKSFPRQAPPLLTVHSGPVNKNWCSVLGSCQKLGGEASLADTDYKGPGVSKLTSMSSSLLLNQAICDMLPIKPVWPPGFFSS